MSENNGKSLKEKYVKKFRKAWFVTVVVMFLIFALNSFKWQWEGFDNMLAKDTIVLASKVALPIIKPQLKVKFDLKAEADAQKSVDAGHSPWKLDPAFVAQVFVSLKLFPNGIIGDYPIDYKEFKVVINNGKETIVKVGGDKTPISRVYLKRLIRQDNSGIWTVVGYDPKK